MAKRKATRKKTAHRTTPPVKVRPEDRDILSLEDAAAYLQLSRSTIYKLVGEKAMPYAKVGGSIRFPRRMLLEWIEKQAQKRQAPKK